MVKHYNLEYWQDGAWFVGRIKEIPGIFSQGKDMNELETNILDAFFMYYEEGIPPKGTKSSVMPMEIEVEV
jgi:predicted RNase H-like HicB family nuclease